MNIAFRIHRLIATSLVFAGLAASSLHAQTPSVAIVNGTTCTSAHAVSVTYSGGALNIQTGGCGTAIVLPPPTLPPTITSVSVPSGAPGTAVTINGTNLAGAMVMIGDAAATVSNNTGQQINTTVPAVATVGAGLIKATTTVAPPASIAFTVTSAPTTAAPVITLVSPASGSAGTGVTITGTGLSGATVTIGGVPATVTTGSATSITTSVPGNAPVATGTIAVTTTGGTTSSPFTVNPPPVGGSDVSVEGITLPNPSKYGFVVPAPHTGANGAGPEINAYSMNTARCATVPALTKSWQHNIDMAEYKAKNTVDFFVMQGGESLSYKFTVPMSDMTGGFLYNDSATATVRPTFMSISSTPCNFDATKIVAATQDSCFRTALNGNSINWVNITGAIPVSYCRLVKGQTYYFNLRFQDARPVELSGSPTTDSCVSGNCGGILQVL